MKLRLRSVDTGETLKLELPSSPLPTFHQLQQLIIRSISPPPPPPTNFSGIYLSFNRKEPIVAASRDVSLLSLGVTSGDLLYFSTNPLSFSDSLAPNMEIGNTQQNQILVDDSDTQMREAQEIDNGVLSFLDEKKYEILFLNRVLIEELGQEPRDYRLQVVAAVHAIMLESGFVRFDSVSGSRADRLQLPESGFNAISFQYRPLKLWGKIDKYVVLNFRILGQFVIVYGNVYGSESSSNRISFDKHKIAPILDLVHILTDESHNKDQKDWILGSDMEKEVLEFWRNVKDELAFPLLIDLCYSTGVGLPPCLMGLPTELKLKILDSLPGADLAKIECACKEMRSLASDDNLWKKKCVEEFKTKREMGSWKKTFATNWVSKKNEEKMLTPNLGVGRHFPFSRMRRGPVPFLGPPMVIGGDHDIFPDFGIPRPFEDPGRHFRRMHQFSPNCNLGGFHA